MKASEDKEFVEGLARGISVIEAFDAERPELTLTEIARKTGHSPAAVRRSIFTLEALGYIRRTEKRFVLTPRILMLGAAYFKSAHVEDVLLPELRSFVERKGDAASVGVLVGRDLLYIAHHSSGNGLRPVAGTGITYPAHATSMGRVLLASADPATLDTFLAEPLKALTDVTVTDPEAFRAIVAAARRDGYATAVDQLAYGVTSIAVPVTLPGGEVIAAVNSSGYTGRVTPETLAAERLEDLRGLATRLASMVAQYPAFVHSLARAA
ncbi:MAG TPA: IclR family transcriptional regulator C-terminal domain-containing protein [Sphingomonas sp.]|nr:IclR family transcriptional regulator C-terminal domain-containing protein [Sphingomonas sp.]